MHHGVAAGDIDVKLVEGAAALVLKILLHLHFDIGTREVGAQLIAIGAEFIRNGREKNLRGRRHECAPHNRGRLRLVAFPSVRVQIALAGAPRQVGRGRVWTGLSLAKRSFISQSNAVTRPCGWAAARPRRATPLGEGQPFRGSRDRRPCGRRLAGWDSARAPWLPKPARSPLTARQAVANGDDLRSVARHQRISRREIVRIAFTTAIGMKAEEVQHDNRLAVILVDKAFELALDQRQHGLSSALALWPHRTLLPSVPWC
jgi:hypothetical protein